MSRLRKIILGFALLLIAVNCISYFNEWISAQAAGLNCLAMICLLLAVWLSHRAAKKSAGTDN